MKVHELRDLLEDYDDNADVLIAHQPSWPLQEVVQRVVSTDELQDEMEPSDEDYDDDDEDLRASTVYLVAGGHPYDGSPYAPRACWEAF